MFKALFGLNIKFIEYCFGIVTLVNSVIIIFTYSGYNPHAFTSLCTSDPLVQYLSLASLIVRVTL